MPQKLHNYTSVKAAFSPQTTTKKKRTRKSRTNKLKSNQGSSQYKRSNGPSPTDSLKYSQTVHTESQGKPFQTDPIHEVQEKAETSP